MIVPQAAVGFYGFSGGHAGPIPRTRVFIFSELISKPPTRVFVRGYFCWHRYLRLSDASHFFFASRSHSIVLQICFCMHCRLGLSFLFQCALQVGINLISSLLIK